MHIKCNVTDVKQAKDNVVTERRYLLLLNELLDGLRDMFFTFLYRTFSLICMLVDFLKDIFYMLCGIDPITISGKQGDLLSSLVESDAIRRSFLIVFVIGSILIVVFTIVAILKSGYSEKMNVFSVLKKSGQSFPIALLVPLVPFGDVAIFLSRSDMTSPLFIYFATVVLSLPILIAIFDTRPRIRGRS